MPNSEEPNSQPIIVDDLTKQTRFRSYDIRIASRQYANIAGMLSGFAFTIVILIARERNLSLSEVEILRRNIAAVGFFASFFGALLVSFVFTLISGEEALCPRANVMAFFGGTSFSLVISLLFWSLGIVLSVFLVNDVAHLLYQIFPLFISIHPIFVVASILDNIYIFDKRNPALREYIITVIPGLFPILLVFLCRMWGLTIDIETHRQYFDVLIWCFLVMVIAGSAVAALFSTADENFRLNLHFAGTWMSLNILLIRFLIIFI